MHLHVFENSSVMSDGAAEWIASFISEQLKSKKRFSLLLSGGNTPKQLYALLASKTFINRIDWQKIDIFFGDERFVPFSDDRNNGKMAHNILLKHVPVPLSQIHFIATDVVPAESAIQYEKTLRNYFNDGYSTFDLALLGIGNDGHTLSLFPGSDVVREKSRWVLPSIAPDEPKQRISLMADVVNNSERIAFLVSGSAKADVVKKIISGKYDPENYPAQLIRTNPDRIHWFGDKAAMENVLKSEQ